MSDDAKVIVAGSRTIDNREKVEDMIATAEKLWGIKEIVHGACSRGVDKQADLVARANDIPTTTFPADWEEHGKAAGPIRNQEMAEYGDTLLALWDGESPGTKSMIQTAVEEGLTMIVEVV